MTPPSYHACSPQTIACSQDSCHDHMAFLLGLRAYVYSSINFIPTFHFWTCVYVLELNNKGYEVNCLKQQKCMSCSSRYQKSDMEVSMMLALSPIRSRAADDPKEASVLSASLGLSPNHPCFSVLVSRPTPPLSYRPLSLNQGSSIAR